MTDHSHSIMALAANGARRLALQEARVDALMRAGQAALLASAREQLHLMGKAQQIRMQLLSAAQREIVDASLRASKELTDIVKPPGNAGAT